MNDIYDISDFKNYITIREAAEKTGIEYHTILARFKRDTKGKYKAFKSKWGWMIHKSCIDTLIEE